jgi:hypothetical protein
VIFNEKSSHINARMKKLRGLVREIEKLLPTKSSFTRDQCTQEASFKKGPSPGLELGHEANVFPSGQHNSTSVLTLYY